MFQFTTRDLLWLAVVVALAMGWWLEHREHVKQREEAFRLISEKLPAS
jgi:lipopolysaccharide biosynthesis regulator YciM